MPSPEGSRELLVVDGYNVIFKSARYLARMDETVAGDPFEQARDLLVADVAAYAKGRYEPVIVFDAAGNVSPERPDLSKAGVRMVFSRTGLLPRAVTVVTSDRTIRATVGGVPVTRISSDVLVADVNQLAAEYERANAERQTQHMRLEDRIDPAAREKLWRMLRG